MQESSLERGHRLILERLGLSPTRSQATAHIWGEKGLWGITDNVLPVTKSLVEKLRSIGNKPDEIGISFGVKLSIAVGAVIASASAEANFGVTVRWTGKKEETSSQP